MGENEKKMSISNWIIDVTCPKRQVRLHVIQTIGKLTNKLWIYLNLFCRWFIFFLCFWRRHDYLSLIFAVVVEATKWMEIWINFFFSFYDLPGERLGEYCVRWQLRRLDVIYKTLPSITRRWRFEFRILWQLKLSKFDGAVYLLKLFVYLWIDFMKWT